MACSHASACPGRHPDIANFRVVWKLSPLKKCHIFSQYGRQTSRALAHGVTKLDSTNLLVLSNFNCLTLDCLIKT
ncbi:hypothetical protein MXB_4101 [Myxobolus squamalis]|nr:hypothetical protein MXB_4101 [Myxobolus squamalis]